MLPPIATIEIVESVMSPPLLAIEDARVGEHLLAGRHGSAFASPCGRARECDATESTTGPEIHGGVTAYARARCRPKSIDHARVLTRTGPVALEVGGVTRPIRVVVAKPGLDGHDRGAKIIARALRDAGVEVIYTGLHQTPQQVVDAAMSEDADFIGMSILSGAHMTLFSEVMDLLKANEATDIVVFGGGIIPESDIPTLEALGVARIFTPGTPTQAVVDWVNDRARASDVSPTR